MKHLSVIICAISIFFSVACSDNSPAYLPKPKGFHRIDLPKHAYEALPEEYPYSFEMSKHAIILPDTSHRAEPYWIEVKYPELTASISISYKKVNNNADSLAGFFNDSHRLTNKHNIRATAIDEYVMKSKKGYTAVLFELEGEVPSQFQYFLTDSTENFLRAALYFPTSTKNDSLAPVINWVKEDMMHMINTTEWRKM
ncbi:gliding motility lipoprotein GldD [Rapidithrix thailandica]|uniref:Gliding motility lipoprotein GldD n=1 Tax=Rapidithrix thailandica TaxID=413964 RepID=A0AAW9RWS2_9BACT